MKIVTAAFIAASVIAHGTAQAQAPRGQGPVSPPANPLEGQLRPDSPSAQPPAAMVDASRTESFTVRNGAKTAAWVTVEQAGTVRAGECVPAGKEGEFRLVQTLGPAKLRAQVSRTDRCEQPAQCDASIARAPGTNLLELRTGNGGCAWQPVANAKPMLKSGGYMNWVRNRTSRWAWITLYRNYWGSTIVSTGCAPPGADGAIYIPVQGGNYDVRTEMTDGANCGGRVVCDTRMNWPSALWSTRYFYLHWAPNNCWLQ